MNKNELAIARDCYNKYVAGGIQNLNSEEESEHATISRKPKKARMAQVSTLSESKSHLSATRQRTLVPIMRNGTESIVETEKGKGGRHGNMSLKKPVHGTLVGDLVHLKVYCEEMIGHCNSVPPQAYDGYEIAAAIGGRGAYQDVVDRLTHLIESEPRDSGKGK